MRRVVAAVAAAVAFPAMTLAAAQAVPSSGGHAVTFLERPTVRLLVSGHAEQRVHLRLRNDGHTVWLPGQRFAVSYRWLTRSGKAAESEGVRTWITSAVRPGDSIELDAQLAVPHRPGLYRLQWDMVEEGVAWFSRTDARPPVRQLVLALPGAEALVSVLVPVTFFSALAAGLWTTWCARRGRLRPFPLDLVWCALSLFTKQLWLMVAVHVPVTPAGALTAAAGSLAPVAVLALWPPRAVRAWLAWVVVLVGSFLVLADAVYFRYFGDVLSMAAIHAARQAPQVWGSVRFLLGAADAWLFVDLLAALAIVLAPKPIALVPSRRWRDRAVAATALALLLVPATRGSVHAVADDTNLIFRNLNLVEEIGPYGYHLADAVRFVRQQAFRQSLTEADLVEARTWFAESAARRGASGETFGAARERNLVMILGESLQGFVIGLRVNGHEITPALNRLRGESLWTTGLVDQVGGGRTSDAELLNAVSLLPLPRGAAAFQSPADAFVGLPRVLAERGYHTVSAVPFEASFWNRRVTHAEFGFTTSYFAGDFQPGPEVGWGLNDRDFLRQMATRVVSLPRPFCAWMITLSLHHPFEEFPRSLAALDLGEWNDTSVGNYLQAMHLLDAGIGEFLDGLRAHGLLEETVVVVQGDHEAGLPWRDVVRLSGFHDDELDWYLADGVPLMIRVPGSGPRGELPSPAGQIDVAPTLLALLGIDAGPLPWLGQNLLGDRVDVPILRRYDDWLDSRHFYLAGRSGSSAPRCFDLASRQQVEVAACAEGTARAERQRRVSWNLLTHGLQRQLLGSFSRSRPSLQPPHQVR